MQKCRDFKSKYLSPNLNIFATKYYVVVLN